MENNHNNRLREMPMAFQHEARSVVNAHVPKASNVLRVKIFKSGNSLALRLPASLGLEAGMEMELTANGDGGYALRPAQPVKRKIDVSKFAGKAPWLQELPRYDFEDSPRDWNLLESDDS
jgi:antitoxin VapB